VSQLAALSENVEEYLEAIHRLSEDPRGVSTTALARRLQVTPASVTGMLRRLRDLGLINYSRYRVIALTDEGKLRARQVLRRHRLAERLLTDVLKVPLDEAHAEACRLEHAVSPELEKRISDTLGAPEVCPHGHPVDVAGRDDTISLAEAPLNTALLVARLSDESPEVVRYLADLGILPGASAKIETRKAAAGTLVVRVGAATHTLGLALAQSVRVHPPRGGR